MLRHWLGRIWPVMRLRTILFGLLLVVAALAGVAAIGLRVYENALVRRTEAELIAQDTVLAASAAMVWPGAQAALQSPTAAIGADRVPDIATGIDLLSGSVLPDMPHASASDRLADADTLIAAHRMAPVLAATRRATGAAILLLDRHGVILNGRDTGRSLALLPEVRAALAGRPVTVLRHNGTVANPLAWLSAGSDLLLQDTRPVWAGGQVVGTVLASRPPSALLLGMWEDRGKIALGSSAIFLFLVGVTAVLGRTIVRPIELLGQATHALAEGHQAEPPRPTLRVREIDGLIHDFTTMGAAIEQRSHYLRDFATALAHEFKTPLTGLRGGIELLQDHGSGMVDGGTRTLPGQHGGRHRSAAAA